MPRAESWTPSRRLQAAALAEREKLERELARLDERHAALSQELAVLNRDRAELREQLHVLARFAGEDAPGGREVDVEPEAENPWHGGPPTTASSDQMLLRGASIREMAVKVLAAAPEASGAIHYRDWFQLFTDAGFIPAGKDPLASFLTQIGRSPVVRRTTSAGVYELDYSVPERLRERLPRMRAQLRDAHEALPDGDVASLARARERRAELAAAIDAAERNLEEALRSLNLEDLYDGPQAAVG